MARMINYIYIHILEIVTHRDIIPAWINNLIPNKVWADITYPFPKFNSATVEV